MGKPEKSPGASPRNEKDQTKNGNSMTIAKHHIRSYTVFILVPHVLGVEKVYSQMLFPGPDEKNDMT